MQKETVCCDVGTTLLGAMAPLDVSGRNREEYPQHAGVSLGARPLKVESPKHKTKNQSPRIRLRAVYTLKSPWTARAQGFLN